VGKISHKIQSSADKNNLLMGTKLKDPLITSTLPGWVGLFVLFVSLFSLSTTEMLPYQVGSVTMLAMFLSMASVEGLYCLRTGSGTISLPWNTRAPGFGLRVLGDVVTVGFLSSFYWIFPEYSGLFYDPFYSAIAEYGSVLFLILVALAWLDCKKDPSPTTSSSYSIGKALISLRLPNLPKPQLADYVLGWIVKLYFLPLMFVYFCDYIAKVSPSLREGSLLWDFNRFYDTMFLIDTAFVCVGYTFASKLIGTHLRSAEKTVLGWAVALVCYQPFWSMASRLYIGNYGRNWTEVVQFHPYAQVTYGAVIILVVGVYVWATISFGTRFSNLTHRGIVYAGPYRYHRHPAYVAKLTSYFLISLPFLGATAWDSYRGLVFFSILCVIYYLRAKTEEHNLGSVGPEYREYSRLVFDNQRRIWRKFKKLMTGT